MTKTLLTLVLALLLPVAAMAGMLKERDVEQLHGDINALFSAFENGDPKVLIARTHPSIYNLTGGKEGFEKIARHAVVQLGKDGIKFLSSELGTPTQTYLSGKEEVCFVPRVSIVDVQGTQVRNTGFMVAIRRTGTTEWKYLDGAAMHKHPQLIYQLFPKLPKGIELPPFKVEPL